MTIQQFKEKLAIEAVLTHYGYLSPIDLNNYQEINEDELHVELNEAGIKLSSANLVSLLKSGICEDYNPIFDGWKKKPPSFGFKVQPCCQEALAEASLPKLG